VNKYWEPLIWTLNDCRKPLSRHKWLLVFFRAHTHTHSLSLPPPHFVTLLLSSLCSFCPSLFFL
jgi:hypothetical protein